MGNLSRRSVLRTSLATAAAGTLARPYLANAAATTATVWWTQGFAEEEDVSFKKIVADYEKASGNTIDYTITPYAPLRQKIVSAVTSGVVPDLFQNTPAGRRAGLSPLAGPRPSVLLGQSPDAPAVAVRLSWRAGEDEEAAVSDLKHRAGVIRSALPLRHSMSPAKTIDEAFRPSSDRDPSHFLASDQPGPALIG